METTTATVRTTRTDSTAPAFEALMVRVGRRDFALPLQDVDYIVPLAPDFPYSGECAEKFLAFQGMPISYVPTWDLIGEKSCYAEFAELGVLLPQRRRDHIDWMSALENSIRNGYPFSKARSPYECAFGKWYYGFRTENRQLAMLLREFEQPHERIHGLASQLIELSDAGRKDEALARLHEEKETTLRGLLDLFDRAGGVLHGLQRRVAVILRCGEARYALGADSVTDILTVPADRVKHQVHATHAHAPDSRLLILDDESICPVVDWLRLIQAVLQECEPNVRLWEKA